ncbi:MAG: M48 family metallopeptidase [Kiritimatiellae bacterium]|jgi:hypothetical protein|nr:M48 family metallopeptidase [Kiritimatiellia bacterium]
MKMAINLKMMLDSLRYTNDSLEYAGIQDSVIDNKIREQFKKHHLVAATKIVAEIFPTIFSAVDDVNNILAPDYKLEVYVKNSADFQASCFPGVDNSISVVLNSGLIQLCSVDELRFVVGHEVGHFLFGHHLYPRVEEMQNQVEKLNILALLRAAEITADRSGFICVKNKENAFKAILKLATGLPDAYIRFDLSAYLRQSKELQNMGGDEYSLLDTHPACCTRMRALLWFDMSEVYYEWVAQGGCAPINSCELNKRVTRDLSLAIGFRLSEINKKEAGQALFWGVLSLFISDGCLSKAEQILLKHNFGESGMNMALDYIREFGPDAVINKFESILQSLRFVDKKTKKVLFENIEQFSKLAGGEISNIESVLKRATQLMNFGNESDR